MPLPVATGGWVPEEACLEPAKHGQEADDLTCDCLSVDSHQHYVSDNWPAARNRYGQAGASIYPGAPVPGAGQSVTKNAPAWGPEKPNEASEEGMRRWLPGAPGGRENAFRGGETRRGETQGHCGAWREINASR
jgi:hypothetical protein